MIIYQCNIHAIVVIWKTPKAQPGCFGFTAHLPEECSVGCSAKEWLEGNCEFERGEA
jgi:hypothetical protein